jgi:threonine dehydrogenase-like Zn-dependent dehydrogenase
VVTGYNAVLKLPAGADPWEYITAEVSAISWRGVTAAYPAPGETAVVVGQGMIGAFAAKWLVYHGARVLVTDLVESRLDRARRWGICAAVNAGETDAKEQLLAHCEGGADIVVETSASVAGCRLGAALLRQPVPRQLHTAYRVESLHTDAHAWPRMVFQATYTATVETAPGGLIGAEGVLVLNPGDRTVGDRLAVIDRIREGDLPVADILDRPVPVEEAPDAYVELRDHPERRSALAFRW